MLCSRSRPLAAHTAAIMLQVAACVALVQGAWEGADRRAGFLPPLPVVMKLRHGTPRLGPCVVRRDVCSPWRHGGRGSAVLSLGGRGHVSIALEAGREGDETAGPGMGAGRAREDTGRTEEELRATGERMEGDHAALRAIDYIRLKIGEGALDYNLIGWGAYGCVISPPVTDPGKVCLTLVASAPVEASDVGKIFKDRDVLERKAPARGVPELDHVSREELVEGLRRLNITDIDPVFELVRTGLDPSSDEYYAFVSYKTFRDFLTELVALCTVAQIDPTGAFTVRFKSASLVLCSETAAWADGKGDTSGGIILDRFPQLVLEDGGRDVRKYLASGQLAYAGDLIPPVLAFCRKLKSLLDAGYVHCDVRPENVLVGGGEGGGVKLSLIDFGLLIGRGGLFGAPNAARLRLRGAHVPPECAVAGQLHACGDQWASVLRGARAHVGFWAEHWGGAGGGGDALHAASDYLALYECFVANERQMWAFVRDERLGMVVPEDPGRREASFRDFDAFLVQLLERYEACGGGCSVSELFEPLCSKVDVFALGFVLIFLLQGEQHSAVAQRILLSMLRRSPFERLSIEQVIVLLQAFSQVPRDPPEVAEMTYQMIAMAVEQNRIETFEALDEWMRTRLRG